jgi:hypothetical protein
MLKYNYLTLCGESRLRPQYLLLYGSHFAVIPFEASPSNIFYFKTSRFVEILSEASPSFNANVLMHCKLRLCPHFSHLAFWASGAVTVLVWPSLTQSVKILIFIDHVLVPYTICVQRGN